MANLKKRTSDQLNSQEDCNNELWSCELELLDVFVDLCKRHNIRYFPCGGTLLGAVRHKGFIPWDDDIDIDMPRADYERLLQVAKELPKAYFLQTNQSDYPYFSGHAKLRKSGTTGMVEDDLYFDYHGGIFIDIFPLDNIPDNNSLCRIWAWYLYFMRSFIVLGSPAYPAYPHRAIGVLARLITKPIYTLFGKQLMSGYERTCRIWEHKNTKRMAPISTFPLRSEVYWPKELYEDVVDIEFENRQISVSKDYHEILSRQFGAEYMIPKQAGSSHSISYVSVDVDYREYREKYRKKENNVDEGCSVIRRL